eukprot:GHVU01012804.1.p1 GENE.GHVU01012804.1~~GHVU01012804.1.p1  ORF type:complete len:652 (-),score=41.61 GHVU01012804.1:1810-3765(-)
MYNHSDTGAVVGDTPVSPSRPSRKTKRTQNSDDSTEFCDGKSCASSLRSDSECCDSPPEKRRKGGKLGAGSTPALHSGKWTDEEHNRFVKALQKFGRDWRRVQATVRTRTTIQVRSHAQKYFMRRARMEGGPQISTTADGTVPHWLLSETADANIIDGCATVSDVESTASSCGLSSKSRNVDVPEAPAESRRRKRKGGQQVPDTTGRRSFKGRRYGREALPVQAEKEGEDCGGCTSSGSPPTATATSPSAPGSPSSTSCGSFRSLHDVHSPKFDSAVAACEPANTEAPSQVATHDRPDTKPGLVRSELVEATATASAADRRLSDVEPVDIEKTGRLVLSVEWISRKPICEAETDPHSPPIGATARDMAATATSDGKFSYGSKPRLVPSGDQSPPPGLPAGTSTPTGSSGRNRSAVMMEKLVDVQRMYCCSATDPAYFHADHHSTTAGAPTLERGSSATYFGISETKSTLGASPPTSTAGSVTAEPLHSSMDDLYSCSQSAPPAEVPEHQGNESTDCHATEFYDAPLVKPEPDIYTLPDFLQYGDAATTSCSWSDELPLTEGVLADSLLPPRDELSFCHLAQYFGCSSTPARHDSLSCFDHDIGLLSPTPTIDVLDEREFDQDHAFCATLPPFSLGGSGEIQLGCHPDPLSL